jgi:hypothetical protein
MQLRLHLLSLLCGDMHEVVDTVGLGLRAHRFELAHLLGGGRHDELAAALTRHSDEPQRIAMHVDEPDPGWFAWTLAEADEGASNWAQIERADEWMGSYKEAMAAGLLVLQQMIDGP